MTKTFAILMMMTTVAGMAFGAEVAPAPEINPASAVSALTLLSGALLVVRSRRKK